MITVPEVAEVLGCSDARIKQLLKADSNLEYVPGRGKGHPSKLPPKTIRQMLKERGLFFKKTIVTIGMEKGGVGKSLLTINAAINLSRKGARVLLVDLDPEACATNLLLPDTVDLQALGSIYEIIKQDKQLRDIIIPTRYEGLDIVPCRGKARKVDRLVGDENPKFLLRNRLKGTESYDLILFEIPPTFSRLISSAYLTSDLVVMPTFPDSWSLESIDLTIEDITEDAEKFECSVPDIKILMNKFNPTRTASKEAWAELTKHHPERILPFQVKDSAELQNTINNGISVFEVRRMGTAEIRQSLNLLADLICPIQGLSTANN